MSATPVQPVPTRELGNRVWRRRPRQLGIVISVSMAVIAIVAACALLGSLLAPHEPAEQDLVLGVSNPSGDHWLGTDDSGRDIFSRLIEGARAAVVGPAVIAIGAALLGSLFGLLAGYRGGRLDTVIMRIADLVWAVPALLVVLVVIGVLGGGYALAVGLLLVLTIPLDTRLVRGATLEQRTRPYVEAARTMGVSSRRVMFRHIWPNLAPLIVANAFLNFAYALVAVSTLAFLGLGIPPGAPDWGRMLHENMPLMESNPGAVLAPGLALVMTAVSMNLLGDWAYERLSDRGRAR